MASQLRRHQPYRAPRKDHSVKHVRIKRNQVEVDFTPLFCITKEYTYANGSHKKRANKFTQQGTEFDILPKVHHETGSKFELLSFVRFSNRTTQR